ncbi:MAG TPA: MXAN_6640 family putative metalloprotease [Gaiellaceae bacterium]
MRLLWPVVVLAAALLALPAAGTAATRVPPPLTPSAPDALERALAGGPISEARHALARAESLFARTRTSKRLGAASRPDPRSATMLLRDLALRLNRLSGADRATAESLLERPRWSGSARLCDAHVCVHWTEAGPDAPPGSDGRPSTVPPWVATTLAVLGHVWRAEIEGLGYRPPLDDSDAARHGGDGRLDIYLSDIGDSAYGYCTSDDPSLGRPSPPSRLSAYCVLDNDFAQAQFPGVHGLPALEVTAAHEFFHAVQFGYDAWEDTWLMEGTATWIEDEVYDAVDDNRRFLAMSPLTQPEVSLDVNLPPYHYGAWIFWRYLSERYGDSIVRDVWRLAGAEPDGGLYSLQAAVAAEAARGSDFASTFADFAVANRLVKTSYAEGRAYPASRSGAAWRLGRRGATTGKRAIRLDHLTSASVVLDPGRRGGRLALHVDLPARSGARARVVVVHRNGTTTMRTLRRDLTLRLAFSRSRVARVLLLFANGSTRIGGCHASPTPFSCSGVPLDERVTFRFRATLG